MVAGHATPALACTGQGDEMAWSGAAIDLRLIDAFPEGVEVLGGAVALAREVAGSAAAAAMTLERFFGTAAVLHVRSSRKLHPWSERMR